MTPASATYPEAVRCSVSSFSSCWSQRPQTGQIRHRKAHEALKGDLHSKITFWSSSGSPGAGDGMTDSTDGGMRRSSRTLANSTPTRWRCRSRAGPQCRGEELGSDEAGHQGIDPVTDRRVARADSGDEARARGACESGRIPCHCPRQFHLAHASTTGSVTPWRRRSAGSGRRRTTPTPPSGWPGR